MIDRPADPCQGWKCQDSRQLTVRSVRHSLPPTSAAGLEGGKPMATTSTEIAIDPGSSSPDAASLRFERLARVRALRRARRRKRVVLITLLVAAVAGVGVLALTSGRGTSSESTGDTRPRPSLAAPPPPVAPTLAPASPLVPASPLAPAPLAPASTLAPSSTLAAPPPRPPVPTGSRAAAPAPRRGATVAAPAAGEADTDDGSAAIDWLLKTRSP
jgi:hypothetical protein